jgi:hypothetical protein
LNDNFLTDTTLDGTWSLLTGDAAMVQLIGADPGQKLVKWNLPDTGFSLQTTTNLTSASWNELSGVTTFVGSGKRSALVPSASLNPNVSYFRMIKRVFTQLQVLLPGETNAPGTVSGKTGSPLAQSASAPTLITVNACDSTWHIINGVADTVVLSTSDGSATLPQPKNLVNGTVVFDNADPFQFSTQATQTVTATDSSDGTKTPNTSSPVTVGP